MQSTHFTVVDTGQRVRGFLDAQTAAIGSAVPPTLRAQLDDGITQVAAFQLEQGTSAGAAHGETTKQQALRDDLWVRFLNPIAGIARKKFRDTTEFPALVVSAALRRSNRIAAKAAECADAAAKDEKTFVDNGLPADFVAQMRRRHDHPARCRHRRDGRRPGLPRPDGRLLTLAFFSHHNLNQENTSHDKHCV